MDARGCGAPGGGSALALRTLSLGVVALCCGCERPPPPPHVVMLIVDTLRADRLGCYGQEGESSPELDDVAERGIRFDNALSQSSWTRPSVASMLTSIYPRTLGIHFEKEGVLSHRFTTLAEVLAGAGYRTLGATANPHLNRSFRFDQGFDHYVDSSAVWEWMEATADTVPMPHPSLPSAMDLFRSVLERLGEEDRQERERPRYLQFDLMEVHETWDKQRLVRDDYREVFSQVEDERERRYLQAVRQISHDVSWFIRELSALPGWERILFVIVSDHGEGLSSHPDIPRGDFHGHFLFESHIRVPWILYSTSGDLPAGLVVDRPVRLLDMMPTLLDFLHIAKPRGVRGVSLLPLLVRGEPVPLPELFVVETQFRGERMGVYSREWKMFHNRDEHPSLPLRELHRYGTLENGAATDVAASHPREVRRMATYLERWESAHPRVPTVRRDRPLSETDVRQLRALGYLE